MNISVNTASMGANAAQVITWVTEAAFLWDLRTNKDFAYSGTTSATTPTSGNALIRIATDWAEWTSYGGSANFSALETDENGGSVVLINPNLSFSAGWQNLILHEAGHSAGYFSVVTGAHSPDSDDLMHVGSVLGKFPVSTADAIGVNTFSSLPSVDTADLSSTYLRADNDMFIPDIVIAGNHRQIQLDYQGVVNLGSGAKHTWNLISNIANEEGAASTSYVTGTTAFLDFVQSMGQDYDNASLAIVGSQVQLNSWTLA